MSTMQDILKNLDENAPMRLAQIIEIEISDHKASDYYKTLIESKKYYANKNCTIEEHIRKIPSGDGRLVASKMLSNIRMPHGFYRKVADQKTGYLLSKPFSVSTEDDQSNTDEYEDFLDDLFDPRFKMQLKQVGIEAQAGSGWMHPQIRDNELRFKRIPAENAIPIWADDERRELDAFIYFYSVTAYKATTKRTVDRVEYWDRSGVRYFERDPERGSQLTEIVSESGDVQAHIEVMTSPEGVDSGAPEKSERFNWTRVPFIPFRVNSWEIPLLNSIKPQVDDFDRKVSDIANAVADLPILNIKDFGGERSADVWEFMLREWAIHTRGEGGVEFMKLDVDIPNLLEYCRFLRELIFEFGRAVDTQSERFSAAISGTAIQKLYADLDMDANDMEAEFQASMADLIWFADIFYAMKTGKSADDVKVDIIFNRDIMLNESEVIKDVIDSSAILSEETALANHPWVSNAKEEMARKEAEAEAASSKQTANEDTFMFPTLPNSLNTDEQTEEQIQGSPAVGEENE